MKNLLETYIVVAAILTACGSPGALPSPATTAPTEPPSAAVTYTATPVPIETAGPSPTLAQPTALPLPVATSRGAELEATDPTTVSLTTGELQLVEFFAFW